MTRALDAWPALWLSPWLLLAGCGSKPAAQPPIAKAAPALAPADASAYDPEWGDECNLRDESLPFGRGQTVEIATCANDPPPPEDTAVPRQYTAHLVVRRDGKITTTLTLGSFVVWEEGHEWRLAGTIESAVGSAAALAIYNDSGVGPGSSSYDLHAYRLSGDELIDIYENHASQFEVKVAADRRAAIVELCTGCGDDGERTTESIELRFDGSKIIERRVP